MYDVLVDTKRKRVNCFFPIDWNVDKYGGPTSYVTKESDEEVIYLID